MDIVKKDFMLDSCAFDPKYDPEDKAAYTLHKLKKEGVINLEIAHSTLKEIDHPNTPRWVKMLALRMIFTIETNLTRQEKDLIKKIEKILAGNGKIENIKEDARHIFECQKYGYDFITTDNGILNKRKQIQKALGTTKIFKPSELVFQESSGNPQPR